MVNRNFPRYSVPVPLVYMSRQASPLSLNFRQKIDSRLAMDASRYPVLHAF